MRPLGRGQSGGRIIGRGLVVLVVVLAGLGAERPGAQAAGGLPSNLTLHPSVASPSPVGTAVTWTASASDTVPLVYQFGLSASGPAGPYTVVRDFSVANSFVSAPLVEGTLYISVTVKEGYSASAGVSVQAAYTYSARVVGGRPAVSATANPLVALYSAPPCKHGTEFVAFRAVGGTSWQGTNAQVCVAGRDHNYLVAGMRPQTSYQMVSVVMTGTVVRSSAPLTFTTGAIPSGVTFPTFSEQVPPGPGSDSAAGTIVHFALGSDGIATDLQGRVIWYAVTPGLKSSTGMRIQQVTGPLGDVIYITGVDGQQPTGDNVFRSIDLAGNPVQETNVQSVNAQLAAMGRQPIYSFNHDALRLPNGYTALLGYNMRTFTSTMILGSMVLVLNQSFQVVWSWDAFDHMDINRGPTLGDTCVAPLPSNCIDWIHANSLAYTASDHNLVVSLRDQDWVVKINYDDGAGDGSVIWRMGPGGDFTIKPLNPSDPFPWFSHQHDFNYIDPTSVEVFDNGNTRCNGAPVGTCDSRGQVYQFDEADRIVTQTINQPVGSYSSAYGTAQRLANGNFNFTSGLQVFPPPPFGQELEYQPNGTTEYVQKVSTPEYRGWRLTSLYAPINPACPTC